MTCQSSATSVALKKTSPLQMQSSAKEPLTRRSTDLPSSNTGHSNFPSFFFSRLTFLKKSKSCQENRYCMYICNYIYVNIERERERISGTPDFKKVKSQAKTLRCAFFSKNLGFRIAPQIARNNSSHPSVRWSAGCIVFFDSHRVKSQGWPR